MIHRKLILPIGINQQIFFIQYFPFSMNLKENVSTKQNHVGNCNRTTLVSIVGRGTQASHYLDNPGTYKVMGNHEELYLLCPFDKTLHWRNAVGESRIHQRNVWPKSNWAYLIYHFKMSRHKR